MTEVPFNLTDVDFIQEGLDFSEIDPVQFENLVFHLIDEMGFSNIQWRKGGEGNSATDGGRDLEATFWSVQPAASYEHKYWFEVKHRTGQLEKSQVQNTVLNASGHGKTDNLVIVTNKTISNPTLDWIKEVQLKREAPSITVWQGHDLEILLRKNPRTLFRFLPTSLAFSGRCKVVESKFTNLMMLPSASELVELWEMRDSYYENPLLTLAVIISEVSYGDIINHPWGMDIDEQRLLSALATGMVNVYPFVFKCSSLNREQAPIIDGLSYLLQCLILRCGSDVASKVVFEPEKLFELGYSLPANLTISRYEPVLVALFHDLAMYCSSKQCSKLHYKSPDDHPDYFSRFLKNEHKPVRKDSFLVMNSNSTPCRIGLVPTDKYCPLVENKSTTPKSLQELKEQLEFAANVIKSRVDELLSNA